MEKRSQLTLFIIIAIVLVGGVIAAIFYFNHNSNNPINNNPNNNSSDNGTVTPVKPAIYATIVSHSEDTSPRFDYLDTEAGYIAGRDALLEMANFVKDTGASWDYEPDWRFLEAAIKYEKGDVLSNTNNKNILRYLSEDLGFQIDAHSHENNGYNYADVAYLINQLGVTSSNIIGGTIVFPVEASQFERFRVHLTGDKYSYTWDPEVLWGAGTAQHVGDEQKKSGLWRPKSAADFFTHDANANLIYVGSCDNIDSLVDAIYVSKTAPTDKIYNVVIFIAEDALQDSGKFSNYEEQISKMNEYVKKGYVKWATLNEIVNVWQNEYNSAPNIFDCDSASSQPEPSVQPSSPCGDGVCQITERRLGKCPEDCG